MPRKFTAVVFPEPNKAELREFELADPGTGEVQVRITTSGVSIGTEYLVLAGTFPFQEYPCLVGYQSVGIVEKLGEGVTNLKLGDRVFVGDGAQPDGYHQGCGIAHVSHANIPAFAPGEFLPRPLLVPDHVSDAAASYLVLVAVALEGTTMANIQRGDTVAVVGLGVVGQLCAQMANSMGANVYASDLDSRRTDLASSLGASGAYAVDVPEFDAELRKIQAKGADVVMETTGNTKVLEKALLLARNYGTFVVQGHYPGNIEFRFTNAHWLHLNMVFPCGGASRFDAMQKLGRGLLDVDSLISHRVKVADAPDLYAEIAKRSSDVAAAVIDWT
jgi:2-desacetyl-2-hydroxyethyl bacteriochlorophyllide A dehydrogenase